MKTTEASSSTASCKCGSVRVQAFGEPIMSVVCYCDDCQAAARQIESLPMGSAGRSEDGGTPYLLYRKDRVTWKAGESLIQPMKLRDSSSTQRVICRQCNTLMMLRFEDGKHWVDVPAPRFEQGVPPPEAAICTRFAAGQVIAAAPQYRGYPFRFIARLLWARVKMQFT